MRYLQPITRRGVALLATVMFLATLAPIVAAAQTPSKKKPTGSAAIGTWPTPERMTIGSVAIDTVPLPERPRFRFETFFLDQLRAAGAIDAQADLAARFRLTIEAIQIADSVGYFIDRVPEVCLSANPPRWCWYIRGVDMTGKPFPICPVCGGYTTDGSILLINSLIANGFLARDSRIIWRNLARRTNFIEVTPTLLKNIRISNWSAQRALDILDRSFAAVSGALYPGPDGYWYKYCREHPEDRICWLIHADFFSSRARNLAQELVLVTLLHQEKLLSTNQTRAIYDVTYSGLTSHRSISDVSLSAGEIIIDGLKLNPKQRVEILGSLATNRLGLPPPDGPWACRCLCQDPPPPNCKFINSFPIATALTTQLVKHKLWSKDDALKAWNKVYISVTGGGGIQPARIAPKR